MAVTTLARRRAAFAICLALATANAASVAVAQGASPFRRFVGTWSGSGTLSKPDGTTERIRCRATYAQPSSDQIQQRLDCTSDSDRFKLVANVSARGSQLHGQWSETTRNVTGQISGSLRSDSLVGTVVGPTFSASFGIAVRGRKQSVEIRSNSADVKDLRMVLSKIGG